MTEDRASDAAGRGPEDSEADAARGTNGKDPPPPLSDDVNNFANGARENMPLLDKVEGIRDAGESPADRLRAERAGTGSSIFDESIDPLRRLIVVLYMLVTPPFVAVTYLLTGPGPRKAWPASAVTLLCLSGMLSARRKRIHRFTLVWPVSIVPVVCCGISFAATGMAGFAAVIGAPTAWASVMLGVPVIAGSVVTAVLTMFAAVFYQTGDWIPSMLSSVVVFVVLSLVGWVGWGKSERHRANQMELRASREKFTLAFEGSHDAIYISDMESGRFLQVNAGFERLSGIPREEAFNHSSADLGLWADPAERAAYFEALREKGFVKHWRARHIRRDGSIFWGESSSTPLMLAGKRVLLTTTRDVTAQQGYEEMLVRARHLAEESAKLKSEFLANMSHEIRTPLNGVIGMTGLLLDTQLSEEQRRLGETVRTSAESLLTLINDILDLSKVEAGKMELEKIDFDLYALCDEFSAAFAIRAHDKGLEFASIIAPDVPRKLHGDPGRLRQILSNLVANSIKFSEHGEVVVRLQLVDNQVSEPQASGPGGRAVKLRIEVSDTGIGIPADKLHVLFKKFSQVDASVTRTHGGTGLGLAICRELVKMMGGDIGVESVEGRGSTFWLTVNLEAKAERSVLGRRRKLVSFSANPLTRVLVLERHVPQRESVAGRLRGYGLVPVEAETVDEAQAELEAASARGEPYRFVLAEDTAPSRLGLDLVARLADAVADRGFQAPDVVLVRPVTVREAPPNLEGVRIAAVLTRPAGYAELFGCMAHLLNGGPTATWPIRTSRQESNESQKKLLEGRRVLLVEDNAVNQAVALGMLRKIGVRADAVGNGVEALNALAEFPYDLCLMDVQMPVLDGLEATRRLRSGAAKVLDPHVPVIALTANAMRGDREVCMQAGMDDYLPKPVTMDRVRAVVEKWLAPGASHRRGSGIMLPNPVEMAETCGDGGSRTMLLPSPTPTDKPETSDDGVKED